MASRLGKARGGVVGYWKNRMIQQQEQGWDFSRDDLLVCAECFDDEAIQKFIGDHADATECSYCESSSEKAIAVSLNSVLAIIGNAVQYEFTDPANVLPREDGEWVFGESIMGIEEVLAELGSPTENEEVEEDIRQAFNGQAYVKRDLFTLSEHEQLRYGWNGFVSAVKHERRYLFSLPGQKEAEDTFQEIPIHKMLDAIGKVVGDVGLIPKMKAGTKWFRVRIHDPEEAFSTVSELGTVPRDRANCSNRMSPSGIPMFYGAADASTAIAETYIPKAGRTAVATVAIFETAREFSVLDLTELPAVPSPYDERLRYLRPAIMFFREFIESLTRPITKDGREHIDYVPTQIVTEYFRHVYKTPQGESVQGILYRSSKPGAGVCCVLFFENKNCCEASTGWEAHQDNCLGLRESFRKEM